ncbi:hypothetical protein H4R34_004676 [Dimargaris verticillata]|uniref:ABC transporter domain-containing protein n=1 Tax=Dimargaris verticillata TaxID=2761393 RepID=A0A9W8E7W1_9FUNG|nr:hypothetical protein H4R34_004676 [Dimargaris verticillata]
MDVPLMPALSRLWALGLLLTLSFVQLWQFVAYQRTEAYRSKESFPPTFVNYPYPSVNHTIQKDLAKQFERAQRFLATLLVCVYGVGFASIIYAYRVSIDDYPLFSVVIDSFYCLAHVSIWMWFTFRRYSSRSASHDDSCLWLFNTFPKTNAFLGLWLQRTALEACAGLLLVASAASRQEASDRLRPRQTVAWGLACSAFLVSGYALLWAIRYHVRYGIPLIQPSLVRAIAQLPAPAQQLGQRHTSIRPLTTAFHLKRWPCMGPAFGLVSTNHCHVQRIAELEQRRRAVYEIVMFHFYGEGLKLITDPVQQHPFETHRELPVIVDELQFLRVGFATLTLASQFWWPVALNALWAIMPALIEQGRTYLSDEFKRQLTVNTAYLVSYIGLVVTPSVLQSVLILILVAHVQETFKTRITHRIYTTIFATVFDGDYKADFRSMLSYGFSSLNRKLKQLICQTTPELVKGLITLMGQYLVLASTLKLEMGLLIMVFGTYVAVTFLYTRLAEDQFSLAQSMAHLDAQSVISSRAYYIADFKRHGSLAFEFMNMNAGLWHCEGMKSQRAGVPLAFACRVGEALLFIPWAVICLGKFHAGSISHAECLVAIAVYRDIIRCLYENALGLYRNFQFSIFLLQFTHELKANQDRLASHVLAPNFQVTQGEVVFHHVSYSANAIPILADLNFTIPAGKVTAIVGRTGSGKSTLVKLITRMIEPTDGHIQIDGQGIQHADPQRLRSQIALVSQVKQLFSRSVYFNIAYGQIGSGALAPMDHVVAVSKTCQLYDKVMADPKGFDYELKRNGTTLSGGERQKCTIARALVKDAPIVLFDEATSALDSETEILVMEAIKKSTQTKTVVIVAHRLSTILEADQIIVLDQGKLHEQGSHQELLAQRGIYWEMWQKCGAYDRVEDDHVEVRKDGT